MSSKIYGVIMAGGGGTRFWPLSRRKNPKQLLNLSGKDVMINEALDRIAQITPYKNIFIVTNDWQGDTVRDVTRGRIAKKRILCEPAARNTAACIGYAAFEIMKKYGDGIMVITPSDAYIVDNEEFARVLEKAAEVAESTDKLVTVGIAPTSPATGYGYIRMEKSDAEVRKVLQFVEKPDLETAKRYLKNGNFVWNSGMFIWKASVILKKYEELLPDIYADLLKINEAVGTPQEKEICNEIYPTIRSVSVDYGILERSNDILVIPGNFGWNDVGSLDMLSVLHKPDENGNVCLGDIMSIDTKDSIIYSDNKFVATIGVENLIVVQTADAVLICPKDRAQEVKKIVEQLQEDRKEDLL